MTLTLELSRSSIFPRLPIDSYPVRIPMITGIAFLFGSVVFATAWCVYWKMFAKEGKCCHRDYVKLITSISGPVERLEFD